MRKLFIPFLMLSLVTLGACGGSVPGVPGKGGAASNVDPNTCGNYAASDVGKKLKAFLEATVMFNDAVMGAEGEIKVSCAAMAGELGVSTEGDTATVCNAVSAAIKEHLSVGLSAGAALTVNYKPAVCTVSVEAAASAVASCEGSASVDAKVTCQGTCEGTCNGDCSGDNEGGQCNGTCNGTCEGDCVGRTDVDASAECRASAEINANVEAKCTEPELDIAFEAEMVADAPKVEAVKSALMKGLPQILKLKAYAEGPLAFTFTTWSKSARDLAGASGKLYASLGDQAACVSGQLAGAASMIAAIKASLDVQVEVSVSVSASASAEGSAGS